jgi:hypothetical protein
MAVVVVNEIAQGSQDLYDQVNSKVMPDGGLPEGCTDHIAGPGASGGWRVITVWDSQDRFQQFRDEKLIPALKEAAGEDFVAPQIEPQEVYRHITA